MEINGYEIDIILSSVKDESILTKVRHLSSTIRGIGRPANRSVDFTPNEVSTIKQSVLTAHPWVKTGKASYSFSDQDVISLYGKLHA